LGIGILRAAGCSRPLATVLPPQDVVAAIAPSLVYLPDSADELGGLGAKSGTPDLKTLNFQKTCWFQAPSTPAQNESGIFVWQRQSAECKH